MTEGGIFSWKVQKIDTHRGPAASYEEITKPLPPPPKNMEWIQDKKNQEWRLQPKAALDTPINDHGVQGITEHTVQPTDTFQGICLKYKISPTELRRANNFSGSNLFLAPNPLKISKRGAPVLLGNIGVELSNDQKIHKVIKEIPSLARSEAKCYLELNEWDLNEALLDAKRSLESDQVNK
mmetsp:Transcript_10383/g.15947  ORF Transcript_10383/g.15947 Transcript_10383/m.15947 type:complete len:181 (+) Transcript_10383:73-615(+)|eukprot:CAMPEP_0178895668 /NCGR_PEP_ID=MMETSP0786-20121207/717_1 /TAXON_ID=186022 /ORGANISM="Thalassionema frauenfeldii, Strain CCMP 1798" /LENGTH=180 /DNA_ID=CAMNT_0020565929 /DNA_START=63 /DNA_END=605 /DNA_ORIENTATION=-